MMRRIIVGLVVALAGAACSSDDPAPSVDLDADGSDSVVVADDCSWPMFGQNISRDFRSCQTDLTADNVADLRPVWFVNTSDVVSASPVVVDGHLYVGDWSGVFYALDAETGEEVWRSQLRVNPQQYGGQISGSAAYRSTADGDQLIVASGDTVYALDAADGSEVWSHIVTSDAFGEVLGSPLVVGDTIFLGFDAHGSPFRSGALALDANTGEEIWYFDPEGGVRTGCGGIWGSPTIDLERGLLFVGTANCPPSRGGWNEYSEALIALDATTGEPQWSFQPHPENDRDTDFAGAPNLFTTADGRDLIGLGNKDAHYYAVDRETGDLIWETEAAEEGFIRPNFASGGFVGPAAVGDGVVIGATAVGDCPCLHGLDASTGEILWQNSQVGPSYAPTTIVGDLAFAVSVDSGLRAVSVTTGELLWEQTLAVPSSGGVASFGDDVWAVTGFVEPGSAPSTRSGIYRFTLDPDAGPTIEIGADGTENEELEPGEALRLVDPPDRCVVESCPIAFGLKDPPPDADPVIEMRITADPFSLTVTATGLGDPAGWIPEGTATAGVGASVYGVMISERDDNPNGGFVCILDESGTCTGSTVPNPGASYSRISILALVNVDVVPDALDGFNRLVETISFNPPLQTEVVGAGTADRAGGGEVVFSGQGNDLVLYTLDGERQQVITNAGEDPENGRDINAQICFLDETHFIAGEDTGQPVKIPGWGIFRLDGDRIGEFTATQVGKLVPTYQPADSQPEMFGCGVLPDGRVVLTDVGNQATGPGTGQLMLFFPPTLGDVSSYRGEITAHCKLDIEIATAQSIAIDSDTVLVAAARGPGVTRYSDLPLSHDGCSGDLCVGCDQFATPTTELFIDPADGGLGIANGIVQSPAGGWYVSSVLTGRINEYDADGAFVRVILEPPDGETLGPETFSTGTPNGLAVTDDGTLWYADLAILVRENGSIGPGNAMGTVRAIRFVDGEPRPPEIIEDGLRFPDALGVLP
ncbi:MAG: PQQ-binding-like beta-propeller repeat protein [Acidimicrobiales bacterium]|nr:PQQ-binding-like beta-propeller repeat protein [Acidimicrobiales bacterium]